MRKWKASFSCMLVGAILSSMMPVLGGGAAQALPTTLQSQIQQQQTQRGAAGQATAEDALKTVDWNMVKPLGTSTTAGWNGAKLDQIKLMSDANYLYFRVDAAHAESWHYIDIALQINDIDSGVSSNPYQRQFNYENTNLKPNYHIVIEAKQGGEAALYKSASSSPLLRSGDLQGAYFHVADEAKVISGAIPLSKLHLKLNDIVKTIVVLSGDRADEHGVFDVIPETTDNEIANGWNMKQHPNRLAAYSEPFAVTFAPTIDGVKDSLWDGVGALGQSVTASTYGETQLGEIKLMNDSKKLYVWVDAQMPNWGDKGQFIDIALNVNQVDSGKSDNPWGGKYNFSGMSEKPQYHIMMRLKQDNEIEGAALYDSLDLGNPILSTWGDRKGAEFAVSRQSGFEAAIPLYQLKLKNHDQLRPIVVLSGNEDTHGAFNIIPEDPGNTRANSWDESPNPNVQRVYAHNYEIKGMSDALELISTDPANKQQHAAVEKPIIVTFSEQVEMNGQGIALEDSKGTAQSINVAIKGQQLIITPSQPLRYDTEYKVVIPAGSAIGKDTHTRNAAYTFSFTTKAQPSMHAAILDQDNEVRVTLKDVVPNLDYTAFVIYDGTSKLDGVSAQGEDEKSVKIRLSTPVDDVSRALTVRYKGNPQNIYRDMPIKMRGILDSYVYTGNDLGVTYRSASSSFKVWAPTVTHAAVTLYNTADTAKETPSREIPMHKDAATGVWAVDVDGNLNGTYYMYKLQFPDGSTTYALDPYARTASVNSTKSAIVELASTNPANWDSDRKPPFLDPTDAIIYELHVRDFSINENSGISHGNRGKFTAFTETGTTLPGKPDIKTGIDHLKELGVTHVHLLPTYDFGSVNEKLVDDPNSKEWKFNWGYDPVNYNIPEGSYTTNAAQEDPAKRIREFKAMVQALHDQGIRVVLDVVYNHTFVTGLESDMSVFDKIVPGYFYRSDDQGNLTNGSGVGNEVATERPMVSKYVQDSVRYWAEEYNVDGFRFDLMKLIDLQTTRAIVHDLKEIDPSIIIYGEPWSGGSTPLAAELQIEKGKQRGEGFAVFNDNIRGAIKGGSDDASTGFATGAEGKEEDVVKGLLGAITDFTASPTETINYVTAHDNLNLWDKVLKTQGKDVDIKRNPFATLTEPNVLDNETVKRSLLANGIVLTAQGIPFLHAGDELLRSKFGDHNSYESPDAINQIVWKQKAEYKPVFDYLKGLIELRSAHPAFRMTKKDEVTSNLQVYRQEGQVIAFKLNNFANGDKWRNIVVIYNGSTASQEVALPTADEWSIVVDHTSAGVETIRTVEGGKVEVAGLSMMVLYDQENDYTPTATKLEVASSTLGLEPGTSSRLTAVVRDQKGRPMFTENVIWSTSDAAVAVMNNGGKVTAVKEGAAVLTATSGKLTAQVNVKVAKLVPMTLSINGSDLIFEGRTLPFTAAVKDQFGQTMSSAAVEWSSSDATVARIDRAGKVTGVREGTAVITARVGAVEASKNVVVKPFLKRYVQINYVRPDAKYDNWGLWVWQTGVKDDGHEFQRIDKGMATATIEIAPEAESIGFIVKKGNWEAKDIDANRFIKTNLDDSLTKVYIYSGQEAFKTLPSVAGPVQEKSQITFYYRDESLFAKGDQDYITKADVVINNKSYPMTYDEENERFVYVMVNAANGEYSYKFSITKDGITNVLNDPHNTVNRRSIIVVKDTGTYPGTKPDKETGTDTGSSSGNENDSKDRNGGGGSVGVQEQFKGMTVTTEGVRYDPSSIKRVNNMDGTKTSELQISNEEIDAMTRLTDTASGKQLWIISAPTEEDDVHIRFPVKKLRSAIERLAHLEIEVQTGAGRYQLPMKQLIEWNSDHAPQQLSLRMKKPSNDLMKEIATAASTLSGARLMSAVQFELNWEQDGKFISIPDRAGSFTAGSIRIPGSHSLGEMTALKYNAMMKSFSFVPSWVERSEKDTQSTMNMKHSYNGNFVVIQYAPSFGDVNGHWAKPIVEMLASKLIVQGRDGGQFAPNAAVTRAEFVTMLMRGLGYGDVQAHTLSKEAFKDVSVSAWYADAVLIAAQLKLIQGDENGFFHPNAPVTREQMAQMLVNAAHIAGHDLQAEKDHAAEAMDYYKDVEQIKDWAREATSKALTSGVLNGYQGRTLRSSETATRAEAGAALTRLLAILHYIAE
ncbi:type I pullulanase [Paenibacillus alvei]|uniref:pullulanase n=1 Tax=Paenibacillus alvei TaxID=44250 RepID=A0AAP7A0U5_PAEAL|nr:type I pullulanase [Paenibacillus alvei]NOJ72374.1 type I pullulanase [Paenibacillus alvei]